jgi:hypothetical protein
VTGGDVSVVRQLIAAEPALPEDAPAVTGWLQRLCRAAERDLAAFGVGVSLFPRDGEPLPAAGSSEVVVALEELQFTLGEGPCISAYDAWRPVLVPDLMEQARSTWMAYAPAAHDMGVQAVFSFPLQLGAARLGAMDVYREETGSLTPASVARALTFAEVAMRWLLFAQQLDDDLTVDGLLTDADRTFVVYQAQGMVMAQLGVRADAALARLRAYAFAEQRPLGEVASDIVARKIVLAAHDDET